METWANDERFDYMQRRGKEGIACLYRSRKRKHSKSRSKAGNVRLLINMHARAKSRVNIVVLKKSTLSSYFFIIIIDVIRYQSPR